MAKRWADCTDLLHVSCVSSRATQIGTVKKISCCCCSKQLSQVVLCLFSCVLTARSQWLSSLASLTFRFLSRPKTMCSSRTQCSPSFLPDQAMLTLSAFGSSFAHCFIFSDMHAIVKIMVLLPILVAWSTFSICNGVEPWDRNEVHAGLLVLLILSSNHSENVLDFPRHATLTECKGSIQRAPLSALQSAYTI